MAAGSELPEGTLLMGRYRVVEPLGAGAHGYVVGAFDETLQRDVAIKVLHRVGDEARERFFREAEACGALDSEHVVKVHAADVDAELGPYIVMERLRGDDLGALLARTGPLPLGVAVRYVLEAMAGVAAAHARGIVHRDLKPSNLFLASDGSRSVVKVVDFGIAKLLERPDALTKTGAQMGTPRYMAPEQLRSARRVDARTDVWALANVLCELVTGAVTSGDRAPPELRQWLVACRAREPSERPDLVQAAKGLAPHTDHGELLVQDVSRALGDAPVIRRTPARATASWKVYLGALAGVVVVGAVVFAGWIASRGPSVSVPVVVDAVAPIAPSASVVPSASEVVSTAPPPSSSPPVVASTKRPRTPPDTASDDTGIACNTDAACPHEASCRDGRCMCATDLFFCGGACRAPDERYCKGCKPCGPREVCVLTLGHPLCGTQNAY